MPPEFGFGRYQLNIIFILKDAHNLILYSFPKRLTVDYKMMKTWQNLHLHLKTCIFKDLHFTDLATIYTDIRLRAVRNVLVNV
jgi:hypothetical protein